MATAKQPDELSQNIRDQFLQCKICLDGLKEPKTLPCLHTFCADCIHYYIGHNRLDDRKFACPICRRHIYIPKHGVEGFPDSFFVTNLNDMVLEQLQKKDSTDTSSRSDQDCGICKFKESNVNASTLCVDCKINLCDDCSKSHSTAKVTQNHTLLPLNMATQGGSSNRENYCRIHKSEIIKFYCETCNNCICLPCTFLDHKDHEITEIKKVREDFNKDMESLVLQSSDNILQLQSVKEDLSDLENELFVRKETVKSEVRKKVQEVVRNLQDQERQIVMQVDEFFETIAVARDRQRIERTIYSMEHAHDFAKQLFSPETSPIAQLTNRKEAKENLEKSLKYELPNVMTHAQKLDRFIHFLPGHLDLNLGTLLKCTVPGRSTTINSERSLIPSSKALYLMKIQPPSEEHMGEVMALAYLPSGSLVILTNLAKKVRIYGQKGKLKYEFGDEDELQHPSDMVITRDGEIAITDCGLRCVKIYDQFGTLMGTFGGSETYDMPIAITTDNVGKYIVCDQDKKTLTVHRSMGMEKVNVFPISEVITPQLMTYYNQKIYICDLENNEIHIYTYSNDELQYVAKLSSTGVEDGHFLDCSAVAVDNTGHLLIADIALDRIHSINQDFEFSNIRPSGKQFLRPNCIAVSSNGLLAVAQQGRYMESVDMEEQGDQAEEEEVEEIPPENEVCIYRIIKSDA